MRTGLKLFGAILVAYVLFVVGMRLSPPGAEQAAAIETLRARTPPVAGRDGSDAMWLLPYQVPMDKRAEVARAYRAWANARDPWREDAKSPPDPRAAYPEQPKPDGEGLCVAREPGCLAYVRANPEKVVAALEKFRPLLDANLELWTSFDGLRYQLEPTTWSQLPIWGRAQGLERTWFAHQFAQGRQVEALGALCAHLSGARRINADTDFLISNMISVATARNDLSLLAELGAELPPGEQALPPACTEAIKPMRDAEFNLCPAMRTEFAGQQFMLEHLEQAMGQGEKTMWRPWLVDRQNILAMTAATEAPLCSRKVLEAARADRRYEAPEAQTCPMWRKVADPIGCQLWSMTATTGYPRYQDRLTDLNAALALMRTALWLRAQGATPANAQQLLDARPAALGLKRAAKFHADTGRIGIDLYGSPGDFQLALFPAS